MLPFARLMAPLAGATCVTSLSGPQGQAIPALSYYGARAGDYLIFVSDGSVPSDWSSASVNLGNATGAPASMYGKQLTASDIAGDRQPSGWWAVLVYRDVLGAAVLNSPANPTKSPRYMGLVALYSPSDNYPLLVGTTTRVQISASFNLYDRVLPFDPIKDGSPVTASQGARIIELRR
jgi:hypothetical protein